MHCHGGGSLLLEAQPCPAALPSDFFHPPITKHFGTDAVSSGCKGTNGPCHGCWLHSKGQPKRSIEAKASRHLDHQCSS